MTRQRLSPTMSVVAFDRGYWYATELAAFAAALGIPDAGRLRKNELEAAIKRCLTTGEKTSTPPPRRSGTPDTARGLRLDLPVRVYTNDKPTKDFLEREMQRLAPGTRRRSGARYRLNRWREAQLARGAAITYRDLVAEYARLNRSEQPFAKVPHGRYINFLAAFLAAEPGATHAAARAAWHALKRLDVPKDYPSWVAATRGARGRPARRAPASTSRARRRAAAGRK